MNKRAIVATRISTDIFSFAAVFVAMGVLQRIPPHRLGYFISDTSLMHPYNPSTIPSWLLYLVSIALIVGTIIAVELALSWNSFNRKKFGLPVILFALYDYLLVAFFGYCLTIAIVDVGKVAVGRPRPNFFASCQPSPLRNSSLGYVVEFACESTSDASESMKSFPSGHSATAMYTAIFLCIYVQLRQPVWRIPALRAAYQVLILCLAFVTCTSRVVDNKHHPTDVIAGALLGLFIAFTVPFYMCRLFPRTPENAVRQVTSTIDLTSDLRSTETLDVLDSLPSGANRSTAVNHFP